MILRDKLPPGKEQKARKAKSSVALFGGPDHAVPAPARVTIQKSTNEFFLAAYGYNVAL